MNVSDEEIEVIMNEIILIQRLVKQYKRERALKLLEELHKELFKIRYE